MFSRREFLASAAVLTAQAQSPRPPNVVFILADDLGYGDLGCYGQRMIQTPHIDALAAQGLRFTQVYSGSTVCAPSRCALMTGRHMGTATVRGNVNPHMPLTADEVTMPEIFKKAGYRTGAFGKWGLGIPPDMHAFPTRKGFDTFYGYLHQVHAHTYFPDMLWDNERESYLTGNFGGGRKSYSHDLITERALKFIDDNHDRPFFLYAPFTPPHGRFEAPDDSPYSDKPWPAPARMIASIITRLDASVGMIVERLKKYGLDRNTLVIFTSDNGPGGLSVRHLNSNGELRGIKRDMYEGGIRVPFIANWPGRIESGTSHEVFASWDMLPTLAELIGQQPPAGIDGVSVLGAVMGRGPVPKPDRHLYWECHERGGFKQAVRWRNWKGIRLRPDGPVEVYDLDADIAETKNLASERPDITDRLKRLIEMSRTPSPAWPPVAGRVGR